MNKINFNQSQFKIGDLVRTKDLSIRGDSDNNTAHVGIVTRTTGCFSGFVEVMIGTWKGSVNWRNLEVIK